MSLESGDFIPQLDDANPPGTDPKSQGDDHLRLIKRCVLGSFPAFVGTTALPASVTLTEDEINDAAQKAADETITGQWTFDQAILGAGLAAYTQRAVAEAITGAWTIDGKKIGYRNPSLHIRDGAYTPVQGDEGAILRTTAGAQLTLDALEAFTTMRFITSSASVGNTIVAGTAAIEFLDGTTGGTGPFNVAPNSVVELYWFSATDVYIFGNGISV